MEIKEKIKERITKFEKELYDADAEYTQEIYTQADYIKLIIWELRDLIKLDS